MNSQICFAMHPADELEFEEVLLGDKSIQFISGPRWENKIPSTSRSLRDIESYCIVWSTSDIATLNADYIPSCNDWYCRSEHATIQFLRSEMNDLVITEGRIAVSTRECEGFPQSSVQQLEKRFRKLRNYIKKTYQNSVVQWQNPTLPYGPSQRKSSANPSAPDPRIWVGPHALAWLRQNPHRRIKQSLHCFVEAVLISNVSP
jgi:hypothetical protein